MHCMIYIKNIVKETRFPEREISVQEINHIGTAYFMKWTNIQQKNNPTILYQAVGKNIIEKKNSEPHLAFPMTEL